jgi:Holliday junction resolvasome RuvABC endonuclease subunit
MGNLIKVVGVDPAFRNTGYAVGTVDIDTFEIKITHLHLTKTAKIEKSQRKVVRANSDDISRAAVLINDFRRITSAVNVVFAEVPHGAQSASAAKSNGVCYGMLAGCTLPLIQLTQGEVKIAAVGKKTATKNEMIDWAILQHPEANWLMRKSKGVMVPINDNEHLADAVATIYAGVITEEFNTAISMMRSMVA